MVLLDGGPMELAGVNLLPYQQAALDGQARFTWNCWARQTGKCVAFGLRRRGED